MSACIQSLFLCLFLYVSVSVSVSVCLSVLLACSTSYCEVTSTSWPCPLFAIHAHRANFEFGTKADSETVAVASGGRRQGVAKAPKTCDAVRIELEIWFNTLRTAGPVSSFLQRQLTCVAILACIFTVRVVLRRCQMKYYPDDPPPPDMSFPGAYYLNVYAARALVLRMASPGADRSPFSFETVFA